MLAFWKNSYLLPSTFWEMKGKNDNQYTCDRKEKQTISLHLSSSSFKVFHTIDFPKTDFFSIFRDNILSIPLKDLQTLNNFKERIC